MPSLTTVLANAGRSVLRAFGAAILIVAPGVAASPNLDAARALGVAGLIAAIASGLRALQDFVPALQFPASWGTAGDMAGSFVRAFLAQLLILTIGVLDAPNLDVGSSAIVGVIMGAITAGFVAIQKYADQKPATA
jgi:hypothetical protein